MSVLFFQPIAWLDPTSVRWGLYGISFAAVGLAVLLLARAYPGGAKPSRLLWAFSLVGLWHTLFLGQVYTLIALMVVGAWLLLRSRATTAKLEP